MLVHVLAILCNVLWSLSYVFYKDSTHFLTPSAIVFWRYTLGILFMLPILVLLRLQIREQTDWSKTRQILWSAFVIGAVGYFLTPFIKLYGIMDSRATSAGILVVTTPVCTMFLAWIFLRERLSKNSIWGIVLVCIGVLILSGVAQSGLLAGELLPNLVILFSIVIESVQGPVAKLAVQVIHPFLLAFFAYIVGSLMALVWNFGASESLSASAGEFPWMGILYLSLVCTTVANTLWYWVVQKMPLSKAAVYIYIQPVGSALFAWFWLGEHFGFSDLMAFGLIFVGIYLAQKN
ncbi:MAG: DMT family transporter [Candidatus Cloacimonetes bacterium]|nr:DMT family transporter [Candidatus Cloacimonadota bacterium]